MSRCDGHDDVANHDLSTRYPPPPNSTFQSRFLRKQTKKTMMVNADLPRHAKSPFDQGVSRSAGRVGWSKCHRHMQDKVAGQPDLTELTGLNFPGHDERRSRRSRVSYS